MAIKKATLTKGNERIAIEVGSEEEKSLFSQGFTLETKPAGDISGGLSLPEDTGVANEFNTMRDILKDAVDVANQNRPSLRDQFAEFDKQVGGPAGAISPAIAGAVAGREAGQFTRSVQNTFGQILDDLRTAETNQTRIQENSNQLLINLAASGILNKLSDEEILSIRNTGLPSPEGLQLINDEVLRQKAEPDKASISDQLKAEEAGFGIQDGQIVPKSQSTITSQSGKSYDLSTFAVDPRQPQAVQNILDNIGKFETIEDIDTYIQSNKSDSPITGQMIANASTDFGIGWEELTALIQHEALLGTSSVSLKNNNPAGITWSQSYQASHPNVTKGTARPSAEGGNYVKFPTLQEGVNSVAEQLGRRAIRTSDIKGNIKNLSPEQKTAGGVLAKQVYGTIKTKDQIENFLNPILQRIANGESIDEISDSLRLQGQSPEFTGTIRDAAQTITSDMTAKKTETVFDKLDDLIGRDDLGAARDFLKKTAIESAGMEQGKQVMGQERTVEFLDEIADDLKSYEDAGGDTNIFTGTVENALAKAGTVRDPELRKIAVKITKARQQYRRAMTGVAFSPGENLEYDKIFPDINKTAEFNSAVIDGLKEAFRGDVDFFYGFQMGNDAYNQIFKQGQDGQANVSDEAQLSDDDAYQRYLETINQ